MKAASVKELKEELKNCSQSELLELCLSLSKFKKENKELLNYLIYEASNEELYVESVKIEVDEQFKNINKKNFYFIKKSVRKILSNIKKYIRYSKKKETEVELLLYFCAKLKTFTPSIYKNIALTNIYLRQIKKIKKILLLLDPDLQFDYGKELEELT